MSTDPEPYRLVAFNGATKSANRIHGDEEAVRYGFRGGLVPGVALYAYLCVPAADALGLEWLQHGSMEAQFRQPVYHGDDAVVESTWLRFSKPSTIDLTLRRKGEICAVGRAAPADRVVTLPAVSEFPLAPLPATPPLADAESLAPGIVLGSLEHLFRWDDGFSLLGPRAPASAGYQLAAGQHPLYAQHRSANPAQLVALANDVLARNVALGPWLHVGSSVESCALVRDGTLISVRAKVSKHYERSGHHFVELEVLLVDDGGTPLQFIRHVAIYQLREPSQM